jgi:hypothetical protein
MNEEGNNIIPSQKISYQFEVVSLILSLAETPHRDEMESWHLYVIEILIGLKTVPNTWRIDMGGDMGSYNSRKARKCEYMSREWRSLSVSSTPLQVD